MLPEREQFSLSARVFPVWELFPDQEWHDKEQWYVAGEVMMSTHVGTHVEFPFHHIRDGADAADYPIERLVGEAVVLDFSSKKPFEAITTEDFKAHESRIQQDDIILLHTGCGKSYRTGDFKKWPYPTPEALQWLVSKRPKAIGCDSFTIEVPAAVSPTDQPNHLMIFRENIALIEAMTNLEKIGNDRVTMIALPLPIEGIDAFPVRVIAFRASTT